jgi:predicted negative regulator of RcsB-dependent stress response
MQSDVGIIAEHLGDVYAKLNLNEKAFENLQKAHELEADQKHKDELQVKITQIQNLIKGVRAPSSASNDEAKKESP